MPAGLARRAVRSEGRTGGGICCNCGVCTVIVDNRHGSSVLLAGFRDERAERPWLPPGWHWPGYPGLIGGQDLEAGGTWLAVNPAGHRVACVLNGCGRPARAASRRSRGELPLLAASGARVPAGERLAGFDPFHLLTAEPGLTVLRSWDGDRLTQRALVPGLYMVVNSGLAGELAAAGGADRAGGGRDAAEGGASPEDGRELARIAHFLPRLRAATRPQPLPGLRIEQAWGDWLPLLDGDGLAPDDPRALIVRHDLGGRNWGTTSVSLVAVGPALARYDFTASPGDPASWYPVRTVAGLPAC
jgi:hypothetical protein